MVLSNDGHGGLSRRQIEEGLVRGALVHCGFDNDAGGDKLWAQVREAYPRAEAIVRERPRPGRRTGTRRYRPSGGGRRRPTAAPSPRSPGGVTAAPMSGDRCMPLC